MPRLWSILACKIPQVIHISEKLKDLVHCKIFIIISNLITIFRTVAGIYGVMTYQKVAEKTAVHVRCVKFFHGCCAWRHLH